ncbi:MAG: hypothetical protein AAF907_12570, partial [Planctomycetota bacterium]
TVLIRLSFNAEGPAATLLIVAAAAFGIVILAVHNLHERSRHRPASDQSGWQEPTSDPPIAAEAAAE